MPDPTDINPADVQVLFADLQKQMVARSKTADPKELAAAAGVLAELAGVFGLPVTVSAVPEADKPPEPIPELAGVSKGAYVRTSASPFLDPPTRAALAGHDRKTLVVAGFATEVVVLHAVVAARREGYRVLVPVDACGSQSDRTERAAFRQIESVGGEPTCVFTLATAMAPDFTTDLGKKMFAVIQKMRQG